MPKEDEGDEEIHPNFFVLKEIMTYCISGQCLPYVFAAKGGKLLEGTLSLFSQVDLSTTGQ